MYVIVVGVVVGVVRRGYSSVSSVVLDVYLVVPLGLFISPILIRLILYSM